MFIVLHHLFDTKQLMKVNLFFNHKAGWFQKSLGPKGLKQDRALKNTSSIWKRMYSIPDTREKKD
jgi:hypothetical protein